MNCEVNEILTFKKDDRTGIGLMAQRNKISNYKVVAEFQNIKINTEDITSDKTLLDESLIVNGKIFKILDEELFELCCENKCLDQNIFIMTNAMSYTDMLHSVYFWDCKLHDYQNISDVLKFSTPLIQVAGWESQKDNDNLLWLIRKHFPHRYESFVNGWLEVNCVFTKAERNIRKLEDIKKFSMNDITNRKDKEEDN